jgi:hypothetical protein
MLLALLLAFFGDVAVGTGNVFAGRHHRAPHSSSRRIVVGHRRTVRHKHASRRPKRSVVRHRRNHRRTGVRHRHHRRTGVRHRRIGGRLKHNVRHVQRVR